MADNSEEERTEEPRHRLGLTASQVAASALAASCAAIVASYLGVAGTISGAAIGSIVATTGSAFYSHAFHTGGKKIVKKLGPSTFLVSEAKSSAATSAQANSTIASESAASGAPTESSGPKRWSKYRTAGALAAALLVVFGAAIAVGLLAGGPIRQAGTGIHLTPSQFATPLPTATRPTGSSTSPAGTTSPSTATANPSASASAIPSGSPDAAPSSDSGTPSQPAAGQSAPGP